MSVGGRAEGRDTALFLLHFGLLLLSILYSLAQIFSWHLWLIFSISVSLYPSVSCLSLSLHCLSAALRHCGDNGWGTWAPTIRVDIYVSAGPTSGDHQLCPRTLPTGLLSEKDHSSLLLKPSSQALPVHCPKTSLDIISACQRGDLPPLHPGAESCPSHQSVSDVYLLVRTYGSLRTGTMFLPQDWGSLRI